ncbi:hypothetical protein PSA01_54480 [Pseudonocardia saturnea]|uniref:Uncharacterized protein n=2 Tax=Pseudonocardia TaxID=1847 RepID=A0A1Y2MGJ1_PSEAH|nr:MULTISPECIES: hypothetical protein [Pseudonocardia]OSY34404.1 hypothetical protein BG845_06894 [Pseudonocardia autotrophica]BBG00401.1 hypothetical protein Pdca_16100 [Pseudonocardia autotrophica]GEC28419.1 hypothetical protein PSA01_54480 [Pseudonocardia saturnea]
MALRIRATPGFATPDAGGGFEDAAAEAEADRPLRAHPVHRADVGHHPRIGHDRRQHDSSQARIRPSQAVHRHPGDVVHLGIEAPTARGDHRRSDHRRRDVGTGGPQRLDSGAHHPRVHALDPVDPVDIGDADDAVDHRRKPTAQARSGPLGGRSATCAEPEVPMAFPARDPPAGEGCAGLGVACDCPGWIGVRCATQARVLSSHADSDRDHRRGQRDSGAHPVPAVQIDGVNRYPADQLLQVGSAQDEPHKVSASRIGGRPSRRF